MRRTALAAIALTAMMLPHAQALAAPAPIGQSTLAVSKTVSSKKLLNELTVKGEHTTGYDRNKFAGWYDADGDGCDTREGILIKEAIKKPKVGLSCSISGGQWYSKYDGVTTKNSSSFDIDHLIPLKEAWDSGAWNWSTTMRKKYANDLGYFADLIAVSASSNRSKGEREPQDWMPSKSSYSCTYLRQWVAVKWRWQLAINSSEEAYLRSHLKACGWPQVNTPPTRAR